MRVVEWMRPLLLQLGVGDFEQRAWKLCLLAWIGFELLALDSSSWLSVSLAQDLSILIELLVVYFPAPSVQCLRASELQASEGFQVVGVSVAQRFGCLKLTSQTDESRREPSE